MVIPVAKMGPDLPNFKFCFVFTVPCDLLRSKMPHARDLTDFFQIVYRRGYKIKLSFDLFSIQVGPSGVAQSQRNHSTLLYQQN